MSERKPVTLSKEEALALHRGVGVLVRNANAWRRAAGMLRGILTDPDATQEERDAVLAETAGNGVFDLDGFQGGADLDWPRGSVSPQRQETTGKGGT